MYRPINQFQRIPKQIARTNEQIKVPEVRVISETDEHIGVMPTPQALALAEEAGLDLVEISPKAKPPLVKIIDYDKFRYQTEKKEQQMKKSAKRVEVKGIRLSLRIGQHDMEFKARQSDKFLLDDKKVKVEMILKGRERGNIEFAFETMKKFLSSITVPHIFEGTLKKQGNTIFALLAPGKPAPKVNVDNK